MSHQELASEIASLSNARIDELRDRWKAIHGRAPSREIGPVLAVLAMKANVDLIASSLDKRRHNRNHLRARRSTCNKRAKDSSIRPLESDGPIDRQEKRG